MTEKQLEVLGFYKSGMKYIKWCGGREVVISLPKTADLDYFWNEVYDYIFEEGVRCGKERKSTEIRQALNLEI